MDLGRRTTSAQFTDRQLNALVVIERICSSLSLMGCGFIIFSFLASKAFHRPINRLVFYASIGNIMTNIATIVAREALPHLSGFLCQFQSFLIQMFMPADAFWTLAMASNVYLTFYWKYDASKLRRIEPLYIALCYGIPFIPAFIFIWIKTSDRGRFYGNAVLWCWIANDWDIWRILAFYGPVWLVIILTVAIYLRAGLEIYKRRKQLRNFNTPLTEPGIDTDNIEAFSSTKTTEISVTSEQISPSFEPIDLRQLDRGRTGKQPHKSESHKPNVAYSVSISSSQPKGSPFSNHAPPEENDNAASKSESKEKLDPMTPKPRPISTIRPQSSSGGASASSSLGSSTPKKFDKEFNERTDFSTPQLSSIPARRYAAMEANTAAWGYTKVALLFFTAMLVTWIPSSANRLYSLVHPGQISIPLEFASALVLPLQGFWNAVIYITTSWAACKVLWVQCFGDGRRSSRGDGGATTRQPRRSVKSAVMGFGGEGKGRRLESDSGLGSADSESMTELTSRPTTRGRS